MGDTSITKVAGGTAPVGALGQRYLASGTTMSMRLWAQQGGPPEPEVAREYETVGYVISGAATLHSEGQTVRLEAGDSWVVPAGAVHTYEIHDPFTAVEATSPPAFVHDRDRPAQG